MNKKFVSTLSILFVLTPFFPVAAATYTYLEDSGGPTKNSAYIIPASNIAPFPKFGTDETPWHIVQWSNPQPIVAATGNAANCSQTPVWGRTTQSSRVCWISEEGGKYKAELAGTLYGNQFSAMCGRTIVDTTGGTTGAGEMNIFLSENPNTKSQRFLTSPMLDKLTSLTYSFSTRIVYSHVFPQCSLNAPFNPYYDQVVTGASLAFNTDDNSQTLFYQLVLNNSNAEFSNRCTGGLQWFFAPDPNNPGVYGVNDYLGNYGITTCPKQGDLIQPYNLNVLDRIKTVIQTSPGIMIKDPARWRLTSFYVGHSIFGGGNVTSFWKDIKIEAILPDQALPVTTLTLVPSVEGRSTIQNLVPFVVIRDALSNVVLSTHTPQPTTQGELIISNLSLSRTKTYRVAVTVPQFLRKAVRDITLSDEKIIFPRLPAGDLNSDQIINSLDWSVMNGHWNTSNATSDINRDGLVNSIDFSFLNKNWLQVGD